MASKTLLRTAAVVIAVGGVGWLMFDLASTATSAPATSQPVPLAVPSSALANAHSISQSTPTVPVPATPAVTTSAAQAVVSAASPYGTTLPVAGDANVNVRSVVEAAQGSHHPERLATLIAPAPFDAGRFAANPQAYVDVVEPGRVFQSAQPGADVLVLRSLSSTNLTMTQEGQVVLRVKTQPLAPVTFTSFDGGRLSNQLVSQTVLADAHGVAVTAFTAGAGTVDGVQVLAGSPMASGQVHFDIHVTMPKQPLAAVGK